VITGVALSPHPPLLLRELGGLQDPVVDLRAAAVSAVRGVVDGAERVVVVGGADMAGTWSADVEADVRRFGTTGARTGSGLPLSLGVGGRLLHDAGWTGPAELVAVSWAASGAEVDELARTLAGTPDDTALLLLGDGSARRSERAPGYVDERAFPFDDTVAKALDDGDARTLHDLDVDLAVELMVSGSTAFRLLGAVALAHGSTVHGSLAYRDDPFGVTYLVATWHLGREGVNASR
jgi:hypothetical protein